MQNLTKLPGELEKQLPEELQKLREFYFKNLGEENGKNEQTKENCC